MKATLPDLRLEEVDITEHPEAAVKYRVMATPAIAINGKLEFVGVPAEEALRSRLLASSERRSRRMTKVSDLKSSAVAVISASISSLCCFLPLVVVVLGLGSGAFMAVTMRYSSIFIPAGILGTSAGYYLYLRERRRCDRLGCRMVGGRLNLVLLVVSTLVLGVSVTLTALPDYTAHLIASWGGTAPMEHGMSDSGEMVPVARVTLQVDGMT